MTERKGYILQENTDFAFETNGKQYKLTVNIEEGMLILREGKDLILNHIYIIDEPSKTYETVAREVASKPSIKSLEQEGSVNTPQTETPVKKAKKSKRKK